MNTRFRLVRSRPARWFTLILGLLLLLAVIGYQIWTLVSHQPTSPGNVFHQAAAKPGTHQPISVQNLSHLHLLWSYTFAPDLAYTMTVANGVVYMEGLDDLVAIQNGKRLWRSHMPDHTQTLSSFQASGNVVYLATNATIAPYTENAIYALNAHTGQELWQHHSTTSIDSLTSDRTMLYFSTAHEVEALANTTGKLQWSHQLSHDLLDGPSRPSLIATLGNLYLALQTSPYKAEPSLIALDDRTGNVKWQMQEIGVSASSPAQAFPFVVANGVIYRRVPFSVFVPNAKAGEDHWRNTAEVSAVDATTGKELWQVPLNPSDSYGWSMQVFQNLLYLPGQNDIQARDLSDGHLVWSNGQLQGNEIPLEPTVSNGVLYVTTEERLPPWSSQHPSYWVYAFNAQSGKLVRMLEDGDSSFQPGSVKSDNEHVYVVGEQLRSGSGYLPVPKPELDVLGV